MSNIAFGAYKTAFRPDVVVLNMHYSGLGIARAMRGADVGVWGLSLDESFAGNKSRYCRYLRFPDPAQQSDMALGFLRDFARQFTRTPIVFATRDLDLEFLIAHRESLASDYILPFPESGVMRKIADKSRLRAIATSIGITCPREARVSSADELARARESIGVPCIVKPVVATQWRTGPARSAVDHRKVLLFEQWDRLAEFYGGFSIDDPTVLIQEYIPGDDRSLVVFGSYHNDHSGLTRYFTGHKVLQTPAIAGTGVAVRAERIPAIVECSLNLLRALGYSGVSEIEYKFDHRTGRYVLIEVNTRHWDQHALGIACGVNVTRALYDDLTGAAVPEMVQAEKPVTWLAEEDYLNGLPDVLRRRSAYSLREYLRPLFGAKVFATASIRDPKPGLQTLVRIARGFRRA